MKRVIFKSEKKKCFFFCGSFEILEKGIKTNRKLVTVLLWAVKLNRFHSCKGYYGHVTGDVLTFLAQTISGLFLAIEFTIA